MESKADNASSSLKIETSEKPADEKIISSEVFLRCPIVSIAEMSVQAGINSAVREGIVSRVKKKASIPKKSPFPTFSSASENAKNENIDKSPADV